MKRTITFMSAIARLSSCLFFCFSFFQPCSAQGLSDVRSRVNDFAEKCHDVFRIDEDAHHAIWEAYCGKLDPKSENDLRFATEIALTYQQKELDKVRELMDKSKDLIRDLDKLRNDAATKSDADDLARKLQPELDNLRKMESGAVLKGSNNPFVQYAIEYGKKMHMEMESSLGSEPRIKDKNFPGMNGRPDLVFIDGDGLWIYEFKPDNSAAMSKGKEQLDRYAPAVRAYFKNLFPNGRAGAYGSNDGDHGGEDFLKKLKACDKCWSSNGMDIEVRVDVKAYSPCDVRF
jgi:hypothetical protein